MLSAAPPKLLLSAGLGLRPPSSTSHAGSACFFTPISSALQSDDNGGGAPRSKGGSGVGALRGSDILFAMQRAVARKESGGVRGGRTASRKGKKRRGSKSEGESDQLLPADFDYGNVRAIEIRDEWGPRIDELQRRIEELRSRYHF